MWNIIRLSRISPQIQLNTQKVVKEKCWALGTDKKAQQV
jgi:hypothetical protein